ncbi:MAG: hypothetical protein ABTQ25_07045 [Nitrosomonas ureae]
MNKNILAYELILLALLMLPGTIIAADTLKNPPAKEKIPIELQREQSQQHTPKRMERMKFAEELPDELKKVRLIHTGIRGGV